MQKIMDILEPWRVGAALREDVPEEIKSCISNYAKWH